MGQGDGPFTVFAPTNEAFNALPYAGAALQYLLNTIPELTKVLQYHVTSGAVKSGDLKDGEKIKMLAEGNVTVKISGDPAVVMINKATVVQADVIACNGVVHEIDQVLVPEALMMSWPTIPTLAAS